jgi:hypothetical protein
VHLHYLIVGKSLNPPFLSLLAFPVTIDVFNRQKDRCRESIPSENRIGMEEMVLIAIVKGNSERLMIHCAPIDDMVDHLIKGDDSIPMSKEKVHVRGEGFNRCIYTRR